MIRRDDELVRSFQKGMGPGAAGQSGDTQGLAETEDAGPESVVELLEEGQSFEAAVINGVENAADAETEEVRTTQVPEDDVPAEYLDRDEPEERG